MNVKSMCSFAGLLGAGVAIATIALVGAAPSDAQQTTTKDQFVGTWKVDVLKTTVGDKVSHPLGDRPSGYVTLTADRIWLLFVDPRRKPPATPALTDAEAAARMKTQVSWTGRYVTGEQTPERTEDNFPCRCRHERSS